MYVTKKQVNDFIEGNIEFGGVTKRRLLTMVRGYIRDLLPFNGEVNNPNQLKYYRRIENRLVELI